MKAKKLLIFLLCFVLLVGALAVVASAKGSTPTTSEAEVTNSDGTVTTKYGNIPKSAASAETYPFAVFRYKNGALDSVVGQKTMRAALNNAKDWNNTWNKIKKEDGTNAGINDTENTYSSTVLLRRDYSTIKYTSSSNVGDKFDNYAQMQNECVVDLNGYTITQGAGTSAIFFQVTSKPSSSQGYIFSTKYTFKNGDIALNDKPLFYGNIWNNLYNSDGTPREDYSMADKHFTFNFENVTFKYVEGATTANMMFSSTGPQGLSEAIPKTPVVAAPFYFTYTDCTFDLTNAPSGAITLFNANPTASHWLKVTVTTNGCEIIAPAAKLANLTLYKTESTRGSSVTFSEGANGDVLTLTLPEGEATETPVSSLSVNVDGKQLYWHNVEGKYVLTECTDANNDKICDKCGAQNVGGKWFSAAEAAQYPFAVLDASGKYVSVQTTWKNATNAAKNKNGYTVVLLRDYTNVASDSNNLKDFKGTLNVDLNGKSFTRDYDGAYIFDNWWDSVTVADTVTVNFKNGTIVSEKWVFNFSGNAALNVEKTANINFDNVTFKIASNNDKTTGWLFDVHSQEYDQNITANITFNECTFDTTAKATNSAPVLNLAVNNKSGVDYVKANVTFNGGKYVANNFKTNLLYKIHSDDTVTFNKGENGEYLTLELKNDKTPNTPAAADYITVGGAKMYFHKNGDVYTLSECVAVNGTHKCSCGFVMSNCADNTNDHKCDVCGNVISECVDANKDHICDICGAKSECIDENKDHVCDLCDKTLTCEECDKNEDHVCDSCGSSFACTDANKDEICDHCGYVMNNYGIKNIDPKYASVDKYPFFVLKLENGVYTFATACSTFYGVQSGDSAMGYSIYSVLRDNNRYDLEKGEYVPEKAGGSVVTAVVVMRRDYDLKSGAEYHNNMAHMQGTTILDLGGHTLREASGSTKSLIYITAKGWTGNDDYKNNGYPDFTFPSTLNITNGRVEVRKYAALTIATSDAVEGTAGFSISNSVYNVNFDGVTFGLVSGATAKTLVYENGSASNAYEGVAKVNVNVNNCVFDFKTNAITSAIALANVTSWTTGSGDSTKYYGTDVDCDVVIEGCEIIASDMSNVTLYKASNTNGSSLIFKKGENGKYITLTMPKGTKAPAATNTFVLDTGVVAAFNKSATVGENDTYTVYPAVMLGYKIKTSVTLYTNFIYNVYVPVANVNKISVNGVVVDYVETEVDGVSYYLVKIDLAAAESLSDIKLTVTLNSGETTVDANWTLSVLKYTGSVINGDYNKVTKNLMKDMLAYATAAHNYFDNALSAEKAAMVESLLAGYSAELPAGEAKTPANSTYFNQIAVNVGEVPSFRFYLQSGYSIADFDFTVGGKTVTATEGTEDGKAYLDVAMFAYMMLDDVTYTVKANGEAGTYNLYSYYNYASKLNIENLTAIVEGLMKYSASAETYRDYVINKPDYGTMSLTLPERIYSNYAGKDITVSFSGEDEYTGEITFTTDNPNVFVENGKIYAVETTPYSVFPRADQDALTVTVTATAGDLTATATVKVSTYRSASVDVEKKVQYYENNIIKEENKGGIIFLGDSYLDGAQEIPPFYRDFYQDWAGEKAFLMGMSSSKIEELETASERIVYPMNPSEIVIHIGHNDMHSGTISPEDFVARLQALINEYHKNLPNTKIYVLSVDPKQKAADPANARHESSFVKVPAVNAAMKAFAEANAWVTYVDTTDIFYTKNTAGELTAVNQNMYPSGDQSHPTLVAYDLIRIRINEARGKALSNVININNADKSYAIGNKGMTYTVSGDFVISGRLVITQFVKANAHLQFSFGTAAGQTRPYRFLIWDGNSDGKFGLGYEKLGAYTNETASGNPTYDATNGLVLNWTIVVKESKAYFFIAGNLIEMFENPVFGGKLSIDATGMDVTLYDIDFVKKSDNATEYESYISPYFAEDVAYVKMYGQGGNISNNGKTLTDASGNNLTNNYIVKGKLNILDFGKSNPHIQFLLGSNYRFLLWDSNRDGKFGAGYTEGSTNVSDTGAVTLYDANGGLVLDWAVVVDDGKAYWYINGKLEKVFEAPTLQQFNLGALQADAYFYDIEIFVKSENATAYTDELGNYFSDSFEISNYDGTAASTVSGTGPTYTKDTFGNELKGSNYVISGSLTITKMNMGANMHLQFYFCNGWRFLIWDQAGNGKFGPGYQENGTHKNDSQVGEKYDGTSGTLTLDWAVVVKDNMAYWFINGELVKTFTEPSTDAFRTINIGATKMVVSVNDVVIYAENGSADYYNATVSKYNV